jgi:hypothetical protein
MGACPQVVESVMADLAVVVIFEQVKLMAENDRVRIFEGKLDVLGFDCNGADDCE